MLDRTRTLRASALALATLLLVSACASTGPDRPLTWDEFETRMDNTVPGLTVETKREIYDFHRNHPEVKLGKALAKIWEFRSDHHPALTKGDIARLWEFHVNHPEVEFGPALADVWAYHVANPEFGKDDLVKMWRFRMDHPEIHRHHLADMWRFHRAHPNQSKEDFQKAYQTYKEDPDGFAAAREERRGKRMERDSG